MENSQGRRPDEVARFGNMNTNYSRPHELTQDVEIRARRAVRVVRTTRVGLSTAAKASTLPTDTSTTKPKESSFQIAAFESPDPRDVGSGVDRTNWFRLHFCAADGVGALLNLSFRQSAVPHGAGQRLNLSKVRRKMPVDRRSALAFCAPSDTSLNTPAPFRSFGRSAIVD